MSINKLTPSLERLVNLLKETIDQQGGLNPQLAKEVVIQADVQEEDLKAFADLDHPIEDCYGRQMVHDNGNFEVMVMSWQPGDYSSIHNHGYTQWGVVQVFGNTHHFTFSIKDNFMDFSKREILPKGAIAKVNNALIHQMGNTTSEPYFTLHIYGCNDRDENVTADAKNYELEHGRIAHTTGGAFFNLPENEIYDFEELPEVSDAVFLHNAYLLMDYYNRQPQSDKIEDLKRNILTQVEQRVLEAVS